MDRIVGTRKEPAMTLHASGKALERGAQHVGTAEGWGRHAVVFKGVRYFKTHEEADEDRADGLARCMAAKRLEKR